MTENTQKAKKRDGAPLILAGFLLRATRPVSHCVGRSVGRSVSWSVGLSHFAFFAFLGILRYAKFVFEHAPAQIITAPAQSITAPAQIIIAPAQLPATAFVVYTALFLLILVFLSSSFCPSTSSSCFHPSNPFFPLPS